VELRSPPTKTISGKHCEPGDPAGGVGKFNSIDLRKFMTGKVAGVTPFINEIQEGFSGSSSRRDLETMFQLIYLRLLRRELT
jgi:hypothetical protein